MKKQIFVIVLFLGLMFAPSVSQANTMELYTLDGFLELLTVKGLIAEDKTVLAQELVEILERSASHSATPAEITVRASQLIESSDLTFSSLQDVQGLVLLVENNGDEVATLWANYACPVTYEIFEDTQKLFDSSSLERCDTDARAQFSLEPGESHMFEINHKQKEYNLDAGEYRFVISYRNYGEDELEVTIK